MAEFSKYKAFSVGMLFTHNNRQKDDGIIHSNENIDNERTVYNYHLKKGSVEDVKKRLSEIYVGRKRKDAVVLGEMIVTLPKDVKKEDERDFFLSVFEFYCAEFGEKNIINAVVHKDEIQPHIHIDFVPVVEGIFNKDRRLVEKWKNDHNGEFPCERLCCKELITQKYLANMHPRLSDYVKESVGYEVGILNGATINGNKTIQQLKAQTLKEEIEKMEKQKSKLAFDVNSIMTIARKHGIEKNDIGFFPLLQKIADLENQNSILRSLILRQGYTWKKEELEAMQAKKYIPVRSVPVNVFDGSLVDVQIDNNAVVVIELPDKIPREFPQKKLINDNMDLERQVKIIQSSSKQVMCRTSRTSDRIYVFIKTDSTKQTMENLILMEQQLKEIDFKNRRLYMDKIENDSYDLARSILIKNQIQSFYFTNRQFVEKAKGNEQAISQELQ